MDLMEIRRGLMAQMGSSYKKIYSGTVTASTTSTSGTSITELNISSEAMYTADKLIYIRIRDKAGKRAGYYYGADLLASYYYAAMNDPNGYLVTANISRLEYRCNSNTKLETYIDAYGLYVTMLTKPGVIRISARYSATASLTIDGDFSVDVYLLDWPNNETPFE